MGAVSDGLDENRIINFRDYGVDTVETVGLGGLPGCAMRTVRYALDNYVEFSVSIEHCVFHRSLFEMMLRALGFSKLLRRASNTCI